LFRFFVSRTTMDWLSPRGGAPVLVELPPLPPTPRHRCDGAGPLIALTRSAPADRGLRRALSTARRPVRYRIYCKCRHRLDRLARARSGIRRPMTLSR